MFKIIKLKGGVSIMKVIQRNKIKFKVFTEEELKEKLGMREEDIQVVLEYQDKFPELLQEKEGFCIDAEKLHKQLGLKKAFTTWIKQYTDKNNKYNFLIDKDFSFSLQGKVQKEGNREIKRQVKIYTLTIDIAKHICLLTGTKEAEMIRKYFIIIEKTLRNYEEWDKVRNPQRENANKLKSELKLWAIRNHFDADYNGLYSREFNLLNVCLTGLTALEIKSYIGFTDKQTREHLEIEINKALDFIQTFDINLIKLNKSFEDRSEMIKQICDITYPNLKFK